MRGGEKVKEMLNGLDEEELGIVLDALRKQMLSSLHENNFIALQKNVIVHHKVSAIKRQRELEWIEKLLNREGTA